MAWVCTQKSYAFSAGKPVVVFNDEGVSVQIEACYQWVELSEFLNTGTGGGTGSGTVSPVVDLSPESVGTAWAWGFGSILTLWLVGFGIAAVVRAIRQI